MLQNRKHKLCLIQEAARWRQRISKQPHATDPEILEREERGAAL